MPDFLSERVRDSVLAADDCRFHLSWKAHSDCHSWRRPIWHGFCVALMAASVLQLATHFLRPLPGLFSGCLPDLFFCGTFCTAYFGDGIYREREKKLFIWVASPCSFASGSPSGRHCCDASTIWEVPYGMACMMDRTSWKFRRSLWEIRTPFSLCFLLCSFAGVKREMGDTG
ncbi:hypothetical protein VTK26DRAFT_3032 [Humicola hyalothermophila]